MSHIRFARRLMLYVVGRWLLHFGQFLAVFLLLVFLVDVLELLRRAASKPEATFQIVLYMGWLKLPEVGERVVVFVMLYSSMFTFWSLGRSRELLVIQGLGISVWQLLTPLLLGASAIGILLTTLIHPLSTDTLSQYDSLAAHYLERRERNGRSLWLRQPNPGGGYSLFYAASVNLHTMELSDVVVLQLEDKHLGNRHPEDGHLGDRRLVGGHPYESRFEAPSALWQPGYWELHQGVHRRFKQPPEVFATHRIPTTFTLSSLADLLAERISFWKLPASVQARETAGLGSTSQRRRYHSLLAQPLWFSSMVLLAAACSLPSRTTRSRRTAQAIGIGIVLGFALFILADVVGTLGESGVIPIPIAVWGPSLVSFLGGVTALLYLEDG